MTHDSHLRSVFPSIVEALRNWAARCPDQIAYTFLADGETEAESLTYGDLDRRARALGAELQRLGLGGENALLLFPPGLRFIEAFFGCLYGRVVAVPAYPPRPGRANPRLGAIARDAGPRVVLTLATLLAKAGILSEQIPELRQAHWIAIDDSTCGDAADWNDPGVCRDTLAFLQYTSGSTTTPRGVMVTHGNLIHNQEMIRRAFGQDDTSVVLGWLPLYHDMGLIGTVLQPLYAGARCILMSPHAFLQRPLRWLAAVSRYRATTSGGPNFAYDLCSRRITAAERLDLDLSSWNLAFNGAEPVRAESLERFAEVFAPCGFHAEAFFPCYGLAEATLFVAGGERAARPRVLAVDAQALERHVAQEPTASGAVRRLVGCGRPWMDSRVLIVDPETLVPCGPGAVGEIWVAGGHVAAGYWCSPEATARDFAASLPGVDDGPFLRTGDLGFVREGELFVTGRLKDLIILYGRNHYPQDIEKTAEASHSGLRPGAGAAFSVDVRGEERLVIVQEVERSAVREAAAMAAAIRQAVTEEHQVGVYDVVLVPPAAVPRTTSGKIQHQACRSLYLEGRLNVLQRSTLEPGEPGTAPIPWDQQTPLPGALATLIGQVLGLDPRQIPADRPLGELGLDSVAAFEIRHRIESELGLRAPLRILLSDGTLDSLAAELAAATAEEAPTAAPPLLEGPVAGERPLSAGQRALWFLHRMAPESAAYNIAFAARLEGDLEGEELRRAFQSLVERHAALRTVFPLCGGEPRQLVHAAAEVDFREEDAIGESESSLRERLAAEARRPFDLERGPLMRIRLLTRSPSERVLCLVLHHIIIDFWSLAVLARELGEDPVVLPAPPDATGLVATTDEACWAWWLSELAGELPFLDLPTDRPRPAAQTFRGDACRFRLDAEDTSRLRALGRAAGATLHTTLLALYQAWLHTRSGQELFLVGVPALGREQARLARAVGYLVNPLPIRAEIPEGCGFRDLLGRAERKVKGALEHQALPFPVLVERLLPERDTSRSPLFQAMLVFHRAPADLPELSALALGLDGIPFRLGGLRGTSMALPVRAAQFDLTLAAAELDGTLAGSLIFNSDLFDRVTIERWLGHLTRLAAEVGTRPDAPLAELSLLAPAERQQILVEWSAAAGTADIVLTVHGQVAAQARRTPDAVAVVQGERSLSYGELVQQARALAHRLQDLGVGPETRVALLMERSIDAVVSILGILEAGGAYVPIDPSYPRERVDWILEETDAPVAVAAGCFADRFSGTGLRIVSPASFPGTAGDLAPLRPVDPMGLAYVLYTSGSTGRPKGVAVPHRSVAGFLAWVREAYTQRELSAVLAATSFSFDVSGFELYAPLACGGRLILVDNLLAFPTSVEAREATLICAVPCVMEQLLALAPDWGSVRTFNLAGEALPRHLAERLATETGAERILNLYGPSEDTIYSTLETVTPGAPGDPAIGRPLRGGRVFLLDRHGRPAPPGIPGEIWLGGEGLARGYLGRPDLTAERFRPDPFSGLPGPRLFRTGDLGRFLPDGRIAYLGRLDDQVKLRGIRIELKEIELELAAHAGVRQAVVVVRETAQGDRHLVAYVVPEEGSAVSPADLRRHMAERLPEPMLPSAFVALEALPLNANGKLDRRALPAPEKESRPAADAGPRSLVEQVLAGIWAELLGTDSVRRDDHFFALGGHSLTAARLAARIGQVLDAPLSPVVVFRAPVFADLAAEIEAALREPADAAAPLLRREGHDRGPLSFPQQRIWWLHQLEPSLTAYHLPLAIRLRGRLSPESLERGLGEVARRHESLRTRFEAGEEPVQIIAPWAPCPLPLVDLGGLPPAAREREARRAAAILSRSPFDLETGPLFRTALLRLESGDHLWLLVLHHAIADGASLEVLLQEVASLYAAPGTSLAEPPLQPLDVALWQRRCAESPAARRSLDHWRERLAELPVLDLPTDRPRRSTPSLAGDSLPIELPRELVDGLKRLSGQRGSTPFMILLAAFQMLLRRCSGQTDIPVGTATANRERQELEAVIGCLANTLVLRTDLSGDPAAGELLDRVRETCLQAWLHQDIPFERLVEVLQSERDPARHPLFQVALSFRAAAAEPRLPGLSLEIEEIPVGASRFDLSLLLWEREGRIAGSFELSRDLFDRTTVQRMVGQLQVLLEGVVRSPDRRIGDLPWQTAGELHQVCTEWSDTAALSGDAAVCVHDLVVSWARRSPEALAVTDGEGSLSYVELEQAAHRLARHLSRRGIGPESVVAVCLERSRFLVVAQLAVLLAGGAYLPLDPAHPAERLSWMVADAGTPLVLTSEALAGRFASSPAALVAIDRLEPLESAVDLPPRATASHLAYVIYTSGSTGTPKGVEVEHRALRNLVDWHCRDYGIAPSHRATQLAAPGFDAAVWEIWPYLASGASVHIAEETLRWSADRLVAWLATAGITHCFMPTPLAELALAEEWPREAALEVLLTGGDRLRRGASPGQRFLLVNHYGPTEAAVVTTRGAVGVGDGPPPIGRPVGNTRILVLGPDGERVATGVPGELFVGGTGLARGYRGRPELTAERFVPDPVSAEPGGRLYRSGDLVRWRPDGALEFLGRIDDQVKVRGVRIELGEVEAALARHPAVREGAVVADRGRSGEQRLTAFVTVRPGCVATGEELRAFLTGLLPDPMVPAAILPQAELPRTPNGKLDRRALLGISRPEVQRIFVGPRTAVEEIVAGLWSELLGVERIGIHDNFFALGGHSLQVAQLARRLRATLGADLPLRSIFMAPTLADLASEVIAQLVAQVGDEAMAEILGDFEAVGPRETVR